MASASSFRVDQRVTIAGKGIGTIAFVGKTEFADGEWIGIILDEPKGKNNGSVQKKDGKTVQYFSCNDNHGLYVRANQIESVISDAQTNLSRSASNQSVKSQNSTTGSIPIPVTTGNSTKPPGTSSKATGLRAPASNTPVRPPPPAGYDDEIDSSGNKIIASLHFMHAVARSAKSSNEITTPTVTEKVSPPKEQIKRPPTPTIQSKPSPPTALPSEPIIPTAQQLPKSQEFAAPEACEQLLCKGHPCAKCHKCRDWHFNGDQETWNWICNYKNWRKVDEDRWRKGASNLLEKRIDATCTGRIAGHIGCSFSFGLSIGGSGTTIGAPYARLCLCEKH
ncbi:unnamed protein product [Adineta steineri]|uniref:CAP-Gly domain-containing protein n=1 Tax=Adineta steineri TaxID=433720 RepID=A0A814C3Y9_9BILA|nr:unnamed protein product [Adineta steineri]